MTNFKFVSSVNERLLLDSKFEKLSNDEPEIKPEAKIFARNWLARLCQSKAKAKIVGQLSVSFLDLSEVGGVNWFY